MRKLSFIFFVLFFVISCADGTLDVVENIDDISNSLSDVDQNLDDIPNSPDGNDEDLAGPDHSASWNLSVKNGQLVDQNDEEFIPYGFNSVHIWLNEDDMLDALKNEIPKSGANTVRLVTSGSSWTWNNQSINATQKRKLIETSIEAGLVPMLEMHDATCLDECDLPAGNGKMGLKQLVDEWLTPEMIELLKDYEGQLLVNIANEWGPDSKVYLDCYKEAITRFRDVGINNVLVIDAGRCGQGVNTLLNYADELYNHDPLKNIVHSIHLYGFWRTEDKTFTDWTPPYSVEEMFPKLADLEGPVIIGEFGWRGEGSAINYNPEIVLQVAKENGIGWLFWAWYDGDDKQYYNTISSTQYKYESDAALTEGGQFLINDVEYGMKNIARQISN